MHCSSGKYRKFAQKTLNYQLQSMKKVTLLTAMALFLLSAPGFAQRVTEISEDLQRIGRQPAFAMELDHPAKTVETVLGQRFKNDRLKGKSSRGAVKFENVRYLPISDVPIDLYTKVTGNRKKAIVYVFVSKGYENFVTSNSHPVVAENVTMFLTSLIPDVEAHNLESQISDHEKALRKSQREHDKLVRRHNNMTRDVQRSQTNLDDQRTKLERLHSLRK